MKLSMLFLAISFVSMTASAGNLLNLLKEAAAHTVVSEQPGLKGQTVRRILDGNAFDVVSEDCDEGNGTRAMRFTCHVVVKRGNQHVRFSFTTNNMMIFSAIFASYVNPQN